MIGMRHAASVKNRCSECVAPYYYQRNKTYNQIYVPHLVWNILFDSQFSRYFLDK